MNKFIFIFLLFLVLVPSTVNFAAEPESSINIVGVHSYTIDDPSTNSQFLGFYQEMQNSNYKLHNYFMNAKKVNITDSQRKQVAEYIIQQILKINPDYVYITDDAAFEYVGIPLLKKHIKIIASGINNSLASYNKTFNFSNQSLYCIQEISDLDLLFDALNNAKIRLNKFYILYDDTETSYYMATTYEKYFKANHYRYEFVKITAIDELKAFIVNSQSDSINGYIIALQSLYNRDTGENVTKEQFANIFKKYNHKHLEIVSNTIFPSYGYAIACGPDFFLMGKQAAMHTKKSNFKSDIFIPKSSISINIRRLEELNFYKILDANYQSIQKQY